MTPLICREITFKTPIKKNYNKLQEQKQKRSK